MKTVSHQTVKLMRGRHDSPAHGACVMELASMLAGEPFSDHPRSVSRLIATFLRGYNDLLDDERRQDLYAYAAKTVGTAADDETERLRAERMITWADEMWERHGGRSILARWKHRAARECVARGAQGAACYAVETIRMLSCDARGAALALVDELIDAKRRGGQAPRRSSTRTACGVPPSRPPVLISAARRRP